MGYVNSADLGNNGGTTSSLTSSYTIAAGSTGLIVALVGDDHANNFDDITSAQYNGINLTLAAKQGPGTTGNRWAYFYYLPNPPAGTHNVVVNCTNNHWLLLGAAEYKDTNFFSIDAVVASIDPTQEDAYTSPITTVADNAWALLMGENVGLVAPSGGTGATMRTFGSAFGDWMIADSNGPVTPAGVYSMTSSMGSNSGTAAQVHIIASFPPPALNPTSIIACVSP